MPPFVLLVRHTLLICLLALLAACEPVPEERANKPELLLYAGITMVQPMTALIELFEQREQATITLTQGGSEDLYQSLRAAGTGDLYLPGSGAYRERRLSEGLLTEAVHIGYNQAAIVVARGNPFAVSADLRQLLRDELRVVICDPQTGSIGSETREILTAAGLFDDVFKRAIYLTTDSRNLNNAIKSGEADVTLNWRATAFFASNREQVESIDLPATLAPPRKIELNLLRFSSHPELARRFMALAASPEGQAIMRQHGFLDAGGLSATNP